MPVKCVIIEDADFIREIYHHFLKEFSDIKIVAEASDGQSGLSAVIKHQPDILLLDLVLPLKNGFEVLDQISSASPKTKTIVISSLDDQATINKAKAMGAVSYIKKPFSKTELTKIISEISKDYSGVQNG